MPRQVNLGVRVLGIKSDYDVTTTDSTNVGYDTLITLKFHHQSPSKNVARSVAYIALKRNETCPITLEHLTEIDAYYVGVCGHVFSEEVCSLDKCPVCRADSAWTRVEKQEVESLL